MDILELVAEFQSLPPSSQIDTLIRLAHELTMVGREAYLPGSAGLRYPQRLRCLNEVQHRVLGHVLALVGSDPERYPDELLVSLVVEQEDLELGEQVRAAFARSLPQSVT